VVYRGNGGWRRGGRRGGVLRAGAGAREAGWTARPVPLTVDGPIYASSMVMLDSARRKVQVPALARWLVGLGIAATLAANVAHGLGHAWRVRQVPHGRQ
jgi:Protein of unknown function (DUF2637)